MGSPLDMPRLPLMISAHINQLRPVFNKLLRFVPADFSCLIAHANGI